MVQISLLVAGFICLLLGLTVFLSNPKQTLFRLYFSASALATLWILVNGFTTSGPIELHGSLLLFVSRLITPLSLAEAVVFLYFASHFTSDALPRRGVYLIAANVAVAVFSFTHLNVYLDKTGQPAVGSLYPFYALVIAADVIGIFLVLYRYKPDQAKDSVFRAQLSYIRLGTSLSLIPMILIGVGLPLISSSQLADISPLFLLIFLAAAGLAIVRYHLFDLRLLAARSTAYALSLTTMTIAFILATFGITSLLVHGAGVHADSNAIRWINAVLAMILAVSFGYIKKFFDRVTNRIFYRDLYDPQQFLDRLNQAIIDNIELGILLRRVAKVIEDNLKSDYATFVLYDDSDKNPRWIGASTTTAKLNDMTEIRGLVNEWKGKTVVYSELTNDNDALKKILRKNNIAVAVSLRPSGYPKKSLAKNYLILGPKKNGSIYSKDDVRIIEIIANELIIAIQNALRFEEIQNFNATLQQRINDATHKLRRANERLRTLDETKDDFISMASHQLRTPLTSVKGYISMILEGDAGHVNDTQKEMLQQAFFSSQRMVYLIADLLNVSRLKTGKFVIEPGPVNLADMVEQELTQLEETAAARQLTLQYDKPADFPTLQLDETKTRQVIMNFVDNAIYYTPPGGHITVRLIDKPGTIELRVEDNGIGVPRAEQPHLFTKFYRAGNARNARPDGTGLGLFMAKKVIVAQGGSVIFESQEGKGSTFGFLFSKQALKALSAPSEHKAAVAAK